MEKIILEAIKSAPYALAFVAFVVLIIFVFKEYRKVRQDNEEQIKNLVSARLGDILGNVQSEISKFEQLVRTQEPKLEELENNYLQFLDEIDKKTYQINSLYAEIEEKFSALKSNIPNVDELSVRDILVLAQQNANSHAGAQLCTQILSHSDARSKELELAGDLMRKANRYSLALELYEKSHEKDPERLGAFTELMALRAELEPSLRNTSLMKLKVEVTNRPDRNSFARIADALVELDRYEELIEFSKNFAEKIGSRDPELTALALRNEAVGYKELGKIDEAIEAFDRAFKLLPEDDNILKPYLGILEKQGRDDEYMATATKLIQSEPSVFNYQRIYISALIKFKRYDEALNQIDVAKNVASSQAEQSSLLDFDRKIKLATANNAINSDS